MTRKKHPGRPRLRASERAAAVVTLRVKKEEKRALEAAADAEGVVAPLGAQTSPDVPPLVDEVSVAPVSVA